MIGLIKGTARQVKSVSGLPLPIASYNGNLKAPIKKLSLSINPTQAGSGDPYPAGGGKNKLNPNLFDSFPKYDNGVTATLNSDGTISLSGTATTTINLSFTGYKYLNEFGFIEPNQTYKLSGYCNAKVYCVFGVYGSGTDYRDNTGNGVDFSFTAEQIETLRYRMIIYIASGTNTNGLTIKPMICLASATNPTTFAPYSNIRPITGVSSVDVNRFSGPNYWDEQWESGGYDNTTGAKNVQYGRIRNKNLIKVNSSTTYYVKFNSSAFVVLQYDINKNFIAGVSSYTSSGVLNTSANTAYINFYLVANEYGNDISINYPSTDHDYHAYTGNTYTLDLDGTRYGGTIDIVDGEAVMTVTHGYVEYNGTENWQADTSRNGVYLLFSTMGTHTYGIGYCDRLKTITNSSGMNSLGIAYGINNYAIYIPHLFDSVSGITDVASWKTYLSNNNMQVCYPLATPIEIDLTPTQINSLLGQNNIWHDGNGDVEELVFQNRQLYYGR